MYTSTRVVDLAGRPIVCDLLEDADGGNEKRAATTRVFVLNNLFGKEFSRQNVSPMRERRPPESIHMIQRGRKPKYTFPPTSSPIFTICMIHTYAALFWRRALRKKTQKHKNKKTQKQKQKQKQTAEGRTVLVLISFRFCKSPSGRLG